MPWTLWAMVPAVPEAQPGFAMLMILSFFCFGAVLPPERRGVVSSSGIELEIKEEEEEGRVFLKLGLGIAR